MLGLHCTQCRALKETLHHILSVTQLVRLLLFFVSLHEKRPSVTLHGNFLQTWYEMTAKIVMLNFCHSTFKNWQLKYLISV